MIERDLEEREQKAEWVAIEAVNVIAALQDAQALVVTLRAAHEARKAEGGKAGYELPLFARPAEVGATETEPFQ